MFPCVMGRYRSTKLRFAYQAKPASQRSERLWFAGWVVLTCAVSLGVFLFVSGMTPRVLGMI
jgi:hypothetical protein